MAIRTINLVCISLLYTTIILSQQLPNLDLFLDAAKAKNNATLISQINLGIDVNKQDQNGWTALMYAVDKNAIPQPAVLEYIDQAGKSYNYVIPGQAKQPDKKDIIQCVETLINAKADPNIKNNDGNTALTIAFLQNNMSLVQLLTKQAGANINIQNNEGTSLLMIAVLRQDTISIQSLLSSGADVNAKNHDGKDALMLAILKNNKTNANLPIINILLTAANININAQDSDGTTALMIAVLKRDVESVKSLLKAGADVNVKNNNGRTAPALAIENGYQEITKIFMQHLKGKAQS